VAILHWVHMSGFCCALVQLPHSVALRGRVLRPASGVSEFERRARLKRVFRSKGELEAFFFRLEVVIVLIFAAVLIFRRGDTVPHLHISY